MASQHTLSVPTPKFAPPKPGDLVRGSLASRTYRIGERLGEGHFGEVYACTDDWDNQLAAKVLLPKGTYAQVKDRWLDEGKKLLQLRHPNVTYVHDFFEHETTFYVIMERCSFTLSELLKEKDFKGEFWIIPVAKCLLQAVHFMHGHGYVHKDLHAGNIFVAELWDALTEKGTGWTFKVGDLGISRLVGDIHQDGTTLAQWMLPPESLDPKFGLIGHEVDVYHIGLLLMSLLVKRPLEYTKDEILAGKPRADCEQIESPYALPISECLRRRVFYRPSVLELWKHLKHAEQGAVPSPP